MTEISPDEVVTDQKSDEQPVSLRDALEQNFNKQIADDKKELEEDTADDVGVETEEEAESKDSLGSTPAPDDADDEAQDKTEDKTSVVDSFKAPTNWSKEDKEQFNHLPDSIELEDGKVIEIREILTKYDKARNADYTRKTQEVAIAKKEISGLVDLVKPYEAQLKQQNITPDKWISELIQTATSFQQNPVGVLKQLMDSYNITPEQLGITANAQDADPDDDYKTDSEIKLEKRITDLEGQIEKSNKNVDNISNQRIQDTEQTRVNNMIAEFSDAKNDDGNLKHPHWDNPDVISDLKVLTQSGNTLAEAYAKSPAVRMLELEANQQETPDQKRVRKRVEVSKAKKASVRVKNASTSTVDHRKFTLRESLEHNMNLQLNNN